jgi:hypothetical protein
MTIRAVSATEAATAAAGTRGKPTSTAHGLISLLREHVERTEYERHLPDEVADAVRSANISQVCTPRVSGGCGDLRALDEVTAELSRGNGLAGRAAFIANTTAFGLFPDDIRAAVNTVWRSASSPRHNGMRGRWQIQTNGHLPVSRAATGGPFRPRIRGRSHDRGHLVGDNGQHREQHLCRECPVRAARVHDRREDLRRTRNVAPEEEALLPCSDRHSRFPGHRGAAPENAVRPSALRPPRRHIPASRIEGVENFPWPS